MRLEVRFGAPGAMKSKDFDLPETSEVVVVRVLSEDAQKGLARPLLELPIDVRELRQLAESRGETAD